MWCRRSCGTPGYEKSPSVLPPWGFFHKSTVPIIPLKTSHSVSSFAPKGRFGACKCKHSVNCHHFAALGKMLLPDFVDLNKIAVGMFWQHRQIISRLQIVSSHHFVGSTNMVCPSRCLHRHGAQIPEIFDPPPYFSGRRWGGPSKKLTPRKLLGLRNPHSPRPRGAVPSSSGRPQCRRGPGPGRRRKGAGG